MEIRRSCYSVLDDGLYSTADVYPEYRLYSDIDDDYVIDACIEKAFSEGYEYAYQRMFAKSKAEMKEIARNSARQEKGKIINPELLKRKKEALKSGKLDAFRDSRAHQNRLKDIDDTFALQHPAVKEALAAEQARSAEALAAEQARSARMNKALNYYRGEGRELAMKNARKQVGLREAFGNASRGKKAALIGGGLAALGAAGTAGYFAGRRRNDDY